MEQLTGFIAGILATTLFFIILLCIIIKRHVLRRQEKEKELVDTRLALESVRTRAEEKDLVIEKMEVSLQEKEAVISSLQKDAVEIAGHSQRLEAELELVYENREKERKVLEDSFKTQLELLKEHISNLSDSTLKNASSQLKTDNEENMQKIIAPIKAQYEELQRSIVSANELNAKSTAALGQQLTEFGHKADRMDDTARKLTLALKGSSQQMGSWGEMVLKQLLDSQGLQMGRDYDIQSVITDERGQIVKNSENKGMRPDVVLHYPESQDVFVDSKVSIKDYYDYVNETDPEKRSDAMKRHVASLRKHYLELAKKDYSSYVADGRTSIDFVIMFVPNDSALIEASRFGCMVGNHENKNVSNWMNRFKMVLEDMANQELEGNYMDSVISTLYYVDIMVFTPDGRSFRLPVDSSVIDLAYELDVDKAKYAKYAYVNGKLSSVKTILHRGDCVEIGYDMDNVMVKEEWLESSVSYNAKRNIRKSLHDLARESLINRCPLCQPIPGGDIIGFKENNGTVTVHRRSCPEVIEKASQNGDSIVNVDFKPSSKITYPITVSVRAVDRYHLLMDIIDNISNDLHLSIDSLTTTTKDEIVDCSVTFMVHSVQELISALQHLYTIDGVKEVTGVGIR